MPANLVLQIKEQLKDRDYVMKATRERDHYWTALKVAAAVGWALVTAWAYTAAGLPGALIAAVGGALVLFVLSRML